MNNAKPCNIRAGCCWSERVSMGISNTIYKITNSQVGVLNYLHHDSPGFFRLTTPQCRTDPGHRVQHHKKINRLNILHISLQVNIQLVGSHLGSVHTGRVDCGEVAMFKLPKNVFRIFSFSNHFFPFENFLHSCSEDKTCGYAFWCIHLHTVGFIHLLHWYTCQ